MNPLLNTIVVYVVVALFGAVAGWGINGMRLGAQIEKAKAEFSASKAKAYESALEDIMEDSRRMADAAEEASVVTADLDTALNRVAKELKNAKPLPSNCRPDDFRMQNLQKAVGELQNNLKGVK